MAEAEDRQLPPVLQRNEQQEVHGDSDNESVASNEPDNTQISRLETELKDEMGSIARQVKQTILEMHEQMRQKFSDLDSQMQNMQSQIRDQNNNQGITQFRNSTPVRTLGAPVTRSMGCNDNASNGQMPHPAVSFNLPGLNSNAETSSSMTSQTRVDNSVKLKPQTFSGNDEFEDFLTQFEITSEINNWDYKAKSLYLANSLTGSARTLLNELTAEQRRDYASLVQKLMERYGSQNRAEVFRSQLKSRVKGKGETIQQLAMSIRKLTRQSYPNVSLEVIEALSLDHFIDALSDTDIRLRLREVAPKTLAEAEKIAITIEAYRLADKQKMRLVGKVEEGDQNVSVKHDNIRQTDDQNFLEKRLEELTKNVDSIQKSIQSIAQRQNFQVRTNSNNYRQSTPNNRQNTGNNSNFNSGQFQSRGGNSRQNHFQQTHPSARPPRYQNNRQGNYNQPNQGSGFRLN